MQTLFLEAKKASFHFFLGKTLAEARSVCGLCVLGAWELAWECFHAQVIAKSPNSRASIQFLVPSLSEEQVKYVVLYSDLLF